MTREEDESLDIEIYTLPDEDGNEIDYALMTHIDLQGEGKFVILAPAEQLDSEDETLDLYAFSYTEENGEPVFGEIEDEALLEKVFALAEEILFGDEFDGDDEEGDEDEDDAEDEA